MKINALISLIAVMLTGCSACVKHPSPQGAKEPPPFITLTQNSQSVSPDIYGQAPEVTRYGRYLLVSTDPTVAQRDLLSQLIDVHIPASQNPTVADALRYVLRQSGYSLCTAEKTNDILYRQPLPSVHYQLAPIRLRTALQLMAGPAWQLEVDEVQRVVCHHLRQGYQLPQAQQEGRL
ncbi:PilL N-terminal domain-containing protein [Xenorhabdus bovienii]|uniref:PFGI-1 class ICE element type IV pilus protein PilL2 n=1 Tax=Xenorhabdus bovienii TaxID=40576 RepID=UPI00237CCF6C|nr:PilL N-terminal domain-containing protein [Xenorhabdus bovienii]MDE1476128.1 PilL N-terminal domain-containing protein [Xenorhabdus bovienii]MDE1491206.1 PilL N-terminal domain-containing protein [Xenorhabdus bovienii]MDE9459653.1 PilL N-terminal domain-containing protein [Xenorhabdus bovienii]MDE9487962.1 PilL N-terminal domain-containing protein [Xenorhabdus bovienii]MDE9515954.1 PilL N-terminal domain-containing protein [Xenorhabdus bovienii]